MGLQHLLEARGWRVIGPAATVRQAPTLLEAEFPSVVLLDVRVRNDELVTPVALALEARRVPFAVATAHLRPERYGGRGLAGVPNPGKPTSEHPLLAALDQLVGSSDDVWLPKALNYGPCLVIRDALAPKVRFFEQAATRCSRASEREAAPPNATDVRDRTA